MCGSILMSVHCVERQIIRIIQAGVLGFLFVCLWHRFLSIPKLIIFFISLPRYGNINMPSCLVSWNSFNIRKVLFKKILCFQTTGPRRVCTVLFWYRNRWGPSILTSYFLTCLIETSTSPQNMSFLYLLRFFILFCFHEECIAFSFGVPQQ